MEYNKGKVEKEGLTPITCKIIKALTKKDDKLEFSGIPVGEVLIVGFAVKYLEQENRIVVGIWDQTGYIEVSFYNKNESESHTGLDGFYYNEKGLVKVIGKMKNYKDNLKIDGAKIFNVEFEDFLLHKLEVLSDWLFLTAEQNQDEDFHIKEPKKGNNNNFNSIIKNDGRGNVKEENIMNICSNLLRNSAQASIRDVVNASGMSEHDLVPILNSLNNKGVLIYDADSKEIMNL